MADRWTNKATALSRRLRVLAVANSAVGTSLLVRPTMWGRHASGAGRTPDIRIIRVLGGRQLVQGAAQITRPQSDLASIGVAVDVLHMLSMLVVAAVWRTYRRPALVSAAVAGVFAGAGTVILIADV